MADKVNVVRIFMRTAKINSRVYAARTFEVGEIVKIEKEFPSGTYTIRGDDGETAWIDGVKIDIFLDNTPPRIAKNPPKIRIEPLVYPHLMQNMPILIVDLKN
jgi:hypothetical protein